jgi:hypothetical protein
MDDLVRGFALQMLRRLHAARQRPSEDGEGADIAEEPIDEDLAQTPYLSERVELPAQKQDILQHVELLFALSARVPEFLDEYVECALSTKTTRIITFNQNFCCLWWHGLNGARYFAGIDNASCQVPWAKPWKIADTFAHFPSWCRVARTTNPQDIHRSWPAKWNTRRTCEKSDIRARFRCAVLDAYYCGTR